ncbi:hypothetical membrane protein [Thermococcus kodakarensis KOD1]|uniref:Hypothetical membrane protein n=1 Tax=Thermococcus kodakarensis (strain ATCC BAA-918 / JCM 12380 / KOD1) TaxID=69014 RepID=Q5JFC0_THEKO|nr:hypothetical membrane protein [Thermococcus kodakarensis KOD1]
MLSDDNNWVSGFNPFDEGSKEVQREIEYSFFKKAVVELLLIPLLVWSIMVLTITPFGADPNFELSFRSFHVKGSMFVVGPFIVMLLFLCRFPSVWYQMYQFKLKYMETILESLKRSQE